MRHLVIDQWNQRRSPLHSCSARAKLASLLIYLLAIAISNPLTPWAGSAYFLLWALGLWLSRLPFIGVLRRIALVLPFSLTFAALTWAMGDSARAVQLVVKSSLSVGGVLLVIGSTTLPDLLRAAESFGVPRFLALTIQSVYRYLFVLTDQAVTMRWAAASRSHDGAARRQLLHAAAGTITVLFAAAHERATAIQRSMQSRGFSGQLPALRADTWRMKDTALFGVNLIVAAGVLLWLR